MRECVCILPIRSDRSEHIYDEIHGKNHSYVHSRTIFHGRIKSVTTPTSSSSFFSAGQLFQPRRRTSRGGLEWAVESTTVTHSSVDWWDLLLPLA